MFLERCEPRELLAQVTLAPIADNTIFPDQTTRSDGAGPSFFSGDTLRGFGARRALIKFDIAASVPAGAHIDSVDLQLHIQRDRGGSHDFGIYRLQADWGEGDSDSGLHGGDGANALADDATWLVRFTGANPPQPWTNQGGDFNSTASAVTKVGTGIGPGTTFFHWSGAQLISDVQGWLNLPSTQFGWMLKEVDESVLGSAIEFDSRESTTSANRPVLTINYTPAPVNQQPTLNAITDPAAIPEDAGQQIINLQGITAGAGESQNLTVIATSSNPALIPDPTVNYTSPNSSGSLTYTPVGNQSGSAVITVKVKDDGGTASGGVDTITRTFTVNVTPVNDQPTLDAITNPAAILEDAGQQSINLSGITAGDSESQTLSVTAISDNPSLIPNPTVNYSSPNATGSLTFTPVANQSGTAKITVTVKDSGGTDSGGVDAITRTFTVSVTPVNDPPTLDAIPDPQAILQDSGQQTIGLTGISAGLLESQSLSIAASSSNTALIPDPTVIYTSPNATGSLQYTPVSGQKGTSTITVTVRDAGLDGQPNNSDDATFTRTFLVQVISPDEVNHAPSFIKGPDLPASGSPPITDEDSTITVPGWATSISAGPPQESNQTVSFIVTTDNDAAFAIKPAVDPTGTLTFKPAPNAHTTVHVSVKIKDSGGTAAGGVDTSAAQTFDITITKPQIWHSSKVVGTGVIFSGLDVTDDNHVAANDALAVINYINAFSSFQDGKVPTLGQVIPNSGGQVAGYGTPFGYLDVTGDTFVAANDALAIINFINVHPNGEGEPLLAVSPQAADSLMQQIDAVLLLNDDTAVLPRRRPA